jgi:hypothetical protein
MLVVALLFGCSQSNAPMTPLAPSDSLTSIAPSKSSDKTVMLVTDAGSGEAFIVSFETGKVLATLTGLSEPEGACSDGAGHFWVTSTGAASIVEFSTDGTKLGTLTDPSGLPVGCAYDPKTGDLAVTNILSQSYGMGSLEIYSGAKGTPETYSDPSLYEMFYVAYAGSTGTLVLDGLSSSEQVAVASFEGGTFKPISLKHMPIEFPGIVAWSTKLQKMNVGDQDSDVIYRFGLDGKVTGKFIGASGSSIAIFGGTLVDDTSDAIDVYTYPAGSKKPPNRVTSQSGFSQPIGLAVSRAITE